MSGNKNGSEKTAETRSTAIFKLGLFVFFVCTRALHPLLIDWSKVDGKILYAKNTPVVMNKITTVLLMNLVAFLVGGVQGMKLCWQPKCMLVFGMIGTVYAVGDFLEMLSLASLSGGVYQVLLQTKLMITAMISWWLKGTGQSSPQWHVLFSIFLATSAFVLVEQGSSGGGSGGLPAVAVSCVMFKVAVSCYCAVLSEKYLKAFSELPIYAKISGLSTTWTLASLFFCYMENSVQANGFFHGWDNMTCWVTLSFVVKTVSTMYLLQALDSVQKNIGEALAVIVIYITQVLMAGFEEAFELSVFLLAVLVVALVKTYLISPKVQAKKQAAKKSVDGLAAKSMKVVALNNPQFQKSGISTLSCEVSHALPAGVFFGMLGGVHPVCGSTSTSSLRHCDLTLLSHPPLSTDRQPVPVAHPYMPSESLTVLGHVREQHPEVEVSAAQCMADVERARILLLSRCTEGVPELP